MKIEEFTSEDFLDMFYDWQADDTDNRADIEITDTPAYDPELGCWTAAAKEIGRPEITYTVTARDGVIEINY